MLVARACSHALYSLVPRDGGADVLLALGGVFSDGVVTSAVDLNDEHFFAASRIGVVSADWMLAAEFQIVGMAATNDVPKEAFGSSLGCAERADLSGGCSWFMCHGWL